MPALRPYKLFISHVWNYNDEYWSVVNRLNEAPNFWWENLSVPEHDPLKFSDTEHLAKLLRDQMRDAHAFQPRRHVCRA
jgi:hypothetical protein